MANGIEISILSFLPRGEYIKYIWETESLRNIFLICPPWNLDVAQGNMTNHKMMVNLVLFFPSLWFWKMQLLKDGDDLCGFAISMQPPKIGFLFATLAGLAD